MPFSPGSSRSAILGAILVALALPTLACEQISRSAYRKLGTYDPERLANLDARQIRIAFQLDARDELDLQGTLVRIDAGFAGEMREARSFLPVVFGVGAQVAGLPPAAEGMRWTVVGARPEDFPLLQRVWAFFQRLQAQEADRKEGTQATLEEKSAARSQFEALFPEFSGIVGKEGDFEMDVHWTWRSKGPQEIPQDRFPIEVWLLLDPKDGYFQLIKGPLDLG